MQKISGVGDLKLQKYGAEFLGAINQYCAVKQLASRIHLKAPKRAPKTRTIRDAEGKSTYSISLEMFQSGIPIAEIARQRSLSISTIEGHLVRYLPTGEITLEDLVTPDKIRAIENTVYELGNVGSLGQLKEVLGEEFSYGEIKAVLATL